MACSLTRGSVSPTLGPASRSMPSSYKTRHHMGKTETLHARTPTTRLSAALGCILLLAVVGCSSDSTGPQGTGGNASGGSANGGASSGGRTGGSGGLATGGTSQTGGTMSAGGG